MKKGDNHTFQEIDITSAIEHCIGHDDDPIDLGLDELPDDSIKLFYDPFECLKTVEKALNATQYANPLLFINKQGDALDNMHVWYHLRLEEIAGLEERFRQDLEIARRSREITIEDYMHIHRTLASSSSPFMQARMKTTGLYNPPEK